MKDFSCAVCYKKKLFEKRVCYRYPELMETMGDPVIPIPRFDDNGRQQLDATKHPVVEHRELDEDGLLMELWNLQLALPEYSAYQIMTTTFKPVCIEAFVDEVAEKLIEAESEVTQYHVNINDPEIRSQVLGFDIELTDLLEAFAIVRGTKNMYERNAMEEAQRKAEEHSKR